MCRPFGRGCQRTHVALPSRASPPVEKSPSVDRQPRRGGTRQPRAWKAVVVGDDRARTGHGWPLGASCAPRSRTSACRARRTSKVITGRAFASRKASTINDPNDDVGIKGRHVSDGPLAIACSISSKVTGATPRYRRADRHPASGMGRSMSRAYLDACCLISRASSAASSRCAMRHGLFAATRTVLTPIDAAVVDAATVLRASMGSRHRMLFTWPRR